MVQFQIVHHEHFPPPRKADVPVTPDVEVPSTPLLALIKYKLSQA